MMRILIAVALLALLTACGGGREGRAVAACERALAEKTDGKAFSIDKSALRASARSEGADQIRVSGAVTFDPGLPREVKQTMECTTRFGEGRSEPDVIGFQLIW